MDFETLLSEHRADVERFIRYRLPSRSDAEDVFQEVCLAAFTEFQSLKDKGHFKPWLIGIARHKCNDYFRKKSKLLEVSIDDVSEGRLICGPRGIVETSDAEETLEHLGDRERQILKLYFWEELPQADIAAKLNIPLGTVKSRLHTAKQRFKEHYPRRIDTPKGEFIMKKLPDLLPEYTIRKTSGQPFAVRHEELPGMFIVPRAGEKLSFGMYDQPEAKLSGAYHLGVTGEVVIHGVRGVEISSEYVEGDGKEQSVLFAQLTDAHCRYLGGMSTDGGVRRIITFLDGDVFTDAYAIGEDNCGFEVERSPKGIITSQDGGLMTAAKSDVSDVVDRCEVTLGGKVYDTVRLIDIQSGNGGYMLCEYYLDKNGRTILWRRFNNDTWAIERYGKKWTEILPENERLIVNGETYVHWYDCITDYIL